MAITDDDYSIVVIIVACHIALNHMISDDEEVTMVIVERERKRKRENNVGVNDTVQIYKQTAGKRAKQGVSIVSIGLKLEQQCLQSCRFSYKLIS